MRTLAWIDGVTCDISEAKVSIEDRGYLLGDGIYEVVRIYDRTPFSLPAHLERLQNSALATRLNIPYTMAEIAEAVTALIIESGCIDGYLYLQITRGCAQRDHLFPPGIVANMTMYIRELKPVSAPEEVIPAVCITLPDERWLNCNIKTINLLPNLLARQKAFEAGAVEAILYRPGEIVTEGTRSNLFALINGVVRTHPESNLILSGITRGIVISIIKKASVLFVEEAFTLTELESASEVWITSTNMEVNPVTVIDGKQIGNGKPGVVSCELMLEIRKVIAESCNREVV